jgi:hypothetical protein
MRHVYSQLAAADTSNSMNAIACMQDTEEQHAETRQQCHKLQLIVWRKGLDGHIRYVWCGQLVACFCHH